MRSLIKVRERTVMADFQQAIESKRFQPSEIAGRVQAIYDAALRDSEQIESGNFTRLQSRDLERMFDHYDQEFFDKEVRRQLGDASLEFRLSQRMTQAGGKAGRREFRDRSGSLVRVEYEIAVSTTLLFQTFRQPGPVRMSGILCHDRLTALQRIVEHEMTHLVELLIWSRTSCSNARFHSIANRFFGHTEHRHHLVTPRDRALTEFGIKPGDRVTFEMDGEQLVGFVNRVTKRATVLVQDLRGELYSDGERYAKYYVPLTMLSRVDM